MQFRLSQHPVNRSSHATVQATMIDFNTPTGIHHRESRCSSALISWNKLSWRNDKKWLTSCNVSSMPFARAHTHCGTCKHHHILPSLMHRCSGVTASSYDIVSAEVQRGRRGFSWVSNNNKQPILPACQHFRRSHLEKCLAGKTPCKALEILELSVFGFTVIHLRLRPKRPIEFRTCPIAI